MSSDDTTAITIELHQVAKVRWPKEPVCGSGPRTDLAVPLPRLPWSNAAITVPLGEGAAKGIQRVVTLRKVFGYGVTPLVVLLFVLADVLLFAARAGRAHTPSIVFLALAAVGVLLILSGLLPDQVAKRTGTPYVTRGRLTIPAARITVAQQLAKLNPKIPIGGLPVGDVQSRR